MSSTRLLKCQLDHFLLGGRPSATALVTPDVELSYAELRVAVDRVAADLGEASRLVLLEARNDVSTVVTYLAALAGHHPVLVVGADEGERHEELRARYEPAVTVGPAGLEPAGSCTAEHELHPDLAVLLSTSGSTGSPKLVRLSRDNVLANARSIADYLSIGPGDRAITSLPLHYCYGLSVLTSHLLAGAAVVLTDLSVSDQCFWELATARQVTSFAGVPYTFELLAASGFADRRLPSLRYVTQAGGRMAPERVTELARLGREQGWELFVMYGQTEATARMAYLPPHRAETRPECIGVPVSGGSIRIEPVAGRTDGELVYSGPNVMMGYAESRADLARGAELHELRTGDLGHQHDDGLWQVTGRLGRHAKVFGLRLDLERLESLIGNDACLVVVDDVVHTFVDRPLQRDDVARRLSDAAAIPVGAISVHHLEQLPRTASGKPDYAALTQHAHAAEEVSGSDAATPIRATAQSLRDLYAVVLGRPEVTVHDSFVTLGGDSLSFVEISTRLGDALGVLPPAWQHLTPADLAGVARPRRRFTSVVEVPTLLRAVAILLVVITHTDLVLVPGGAHVLLVVVGFNLGRFALAEPDPRRRVGNLLASAASVAVPAGLWIGICALLTGDYRPTTALFLNGFVGERVWTPDWQFWFLEALVWSTLALAALLAVPLIARVQHQHGFATAMTAVAGALAVRYVGSGVNADALERYSVLTVLWCLVLGWAAAEAGSRSQRILVSTVAVVATWGFFGDIQRELLVVTGILLLVWRTSVVLPRGLSHLVGLLAGASLWIYLTHWQVYPGLEAAELPVLAVCASLAAGVAATQIFAGPSARLSATVRVALGCRSWRLTGRCRTQGTGARSFRQRPRIARSTASLIALEGRCVSTDQCVREG